MPPVVIEPLEVVEDDVPGPLVFEGPVPAVPDEDEPPPPERLVVVASSEQETQTSKQIAAPRESKRCFVTSHSRQEIVRAAHHNFRFFS
jgi:hypothetical protein